MKNQVDAAQKLSARHSSEISELRKALAKTEQENAEMRHQIDKIKDK
jgi:cell division protein FtsB